MAEEEQQQQLVKWEGKASVIISGATADQVWPLLADYCAIDRWWPGVDTCSLQDGVAGEPGCVRYCAGKAVSTADGEVVAWAKERLMSIDHAGRKLRYEIMENNIGWGHYEAEMEVIGGGGTAGSGGKETEEVGSGGKEAEEVGSGGKETEEGGGCMIEWAFTMEPVEGGSQEGVAAYLGLSLEGMAKRMEEFVLGGGGRQD